MSKCVGMFLDKNSHIFNHKESGLQVLDTADRYKYKGAMQTLHRALAMGQYVDTTRGGWDKTRFERCASNVKTSLAISKFSFINTKQNISQQENLPNQFSILASAEFLFFVYFLWNKHKF